MNIKKLKAAALAATPEMPSAELVDLTHKSRRFYTAFGDEKFPCEICGKLVWGIRQHRRDVHGIKSGLKRKKIKDICHD